MEIITQKFRVLGGIDGHPATVQQEFNEVQQIVDGKVKFNRTYIRTIITATVTYSNGKTFLVSAEKKNEETEFKAYFPQGLDFDQVELAFAVSGSLNSYGVVRLPIILGLQSQINTSETI